LIDSPANELLFSAASVWEVAIKRGLGRSDFQADPRLLRRGLLDNGYTELPVLSDHVVAIESSRRSTKTHSTACWSRKLPWRESRFSQRTR
jgi:PIN domain nuclease of toxin-antitoxin system